MKYSFGRWSGETLAVHDGAQCVGCIDLQNVFTKINFHVHGLDEKLLYKFNGKKFKSHMDCLDQFNNEV